MTLLIFLASMAVLEFITRRPKGDADINRPVGSKPTRKQVKVQPEVDWSPGLHNLGHALERHGQGAIPADGNSGTRVPDHKISGS